MRIFSPSILISGAHRNCLAALMLALACARLAASPMTVQDGSSATPLSMANLLAGPGVVVVPASVATAGIAAARGTFGNAGDLIGISSGVVLSTGLAASVPTPNATNPDLPANLVSTNNGSPGDADLNTLVSPYLTADASILSFDIIPATSVLEFKYVFSSEEYNYYVNYPYNDVVAFYVNGANIALLPDGEAVSIHDVNASKNAAYFVLNETPGSTLFKNFAINGLTVVLTARAVVTPGVANHIKLAIADTNDPYVDSDVFIAAHSMIAPTLTSTPTPSSTITPTATVTPTFSASPTATDSPSITCTFSYSPSFTNTGTITPSSTASSSFSATPSSSATPTATPTFTASPSFSASPSSSTTPTTTLTFSASPSFSASPTFSVSPTFSNTATVTPTPSITPSCTASPTATASFSATPSFTVTHTATITPTPTTTGSPTASPTQTPRPLILHLYGNSPNPFGGQGTWITYWLQVDARVLIEVYDVSGEKVRTLPPFAGKSNSVNNGNNQTFWDGRNDSGRPVASGVFIYRISATTPHGEERHDFGKCAVLR